MPQRITSALTTMSLAIIMAVLVWIAAIGEEDPILTEFYEDGVQLTINSPTSDVIIANNETLPERIQVQLRGRNSSWAGLTPDKLKASLNLSAYTSGNHTIPVEVEVSDQRLDILEYFPRTVTVQLEPLITREMPVTVRIVGDPPNGFTYRLQSEPFTVTVKGLSTAVSDIERIEASVLLNGLRTSVERNVRPVARNRLGETVPRIVIEPDQQIITIGAEQKFGYSNASIEANVIGSPAEGYFISRITTEPNEILLRGPDDAPNSIETPEIDIAGTTTDIVKQFPLILPPGFSIELDENEDPEEARSVSVTIEIEAFTGGLSLERNIVVEGVNPSLSWAISPDTVEIFLSGPWPRLQTLDDGDVSASIDLFDLPEGTHRVEPRIFRTEDLAVISVIPELIEVTLSPTITATATPQIETNLPISSSVTSTATTTLEGTSLLTDSITISE